MADELLPLRDLEPEEIGWLLKQLARRREIGQIKKEFDYAFAPKTISGGELLSLTKRYPDLFRQAERFVLADISAYALAHTALRLEEIQECLNICKIPQPSHSIRKTNPTNGQDEYVEVLDYNLNERAKFIELAQKEEFMAKKLLLERLKLDADIPELRRSGFRNITVNIGDDLDDDEDVSVKPPEDLDGQETERTNSK